ncbi:MAG: UDP-N-acetylmuramoylalanine--D-glutamate ligase [Saprospiraceae bacterium]|nr:UDP-N-acetylmuramoylalanine--D-glutamate ligase [Saprospiraceae bacterium]
MHKLIKMIGMKKNAKIGENPRCVILGSGESGTGAALLAKRQGFDVFVSDKGVIKEAYKKQLDAHGIAWEEGQHTLDKILNAHEIIKSPGIPEKSEVMQAVRAKGINVIGEIELGYRYAGKCTIVAITGSNGKTTTTMLAYHLLKHAGLNVRMGGNVGNSFATMVYEDVHRRQTEDASRIFVLEVSSFQLDDIQRFRPNIAMLLNITPDHLDRYDDKLENYVRSKFRIGMNQKRGDLFITHQNDENIAHYMKEHPEAVKCRIERVRKSDLKNGYIRIGRSLAFDIANTPLKGPHNAFNAACAIRVALRLGVEPGVIEEGLYYFTPPPHRLEKVGEVNGVIYINDSKATNVDSVFYALQAMDTPTVWIVGGQDKGNDYSPLFKWVKKKVKAIVCMGVDNSKIMSAFKKLKKPMTETRSAEEAVRAAMGFADEGDTVLLSPACASFDLFKNYEDRGEQFRIAVLKLKN